MPNGQNLTENVRSLYMNHKCIAIAAMDKVFADAVNIFIYTFKCNNPDIPINIYILDDYQPSQDMLKYNDVKFIHLDANKTHKFIEENKDSINTRSFTPDHMYDSSKVINMFAYIEAIDNLISTKKYDVIIKSDLDVLWCDSIINDLTEFTKSNLPIAMSKERIGIEQYILDSNGLLSYYQNNGGAFSAGVTLYNARIINSNIFDTLIGTMKKYGIYKFVYLDQDALSLSYPKKFILKGVYNSTACTIPDARDVYALHYAGPFKPFGKITKENIKKYNSDFIHTYALYRDIAKIIMCSDNFISTINTNLATLNKYVVHNKWAHSGRKLIELKCANTLKALTNLL